MVDRRSCWGGSQRSRSARASATSSLASARSTRAATGSGASGALSRSASGLGDLAVADEQLDLEVAVGLDEEVRLVRGRCGCSQDRECGGGAFGEHGESGVERPLEIEVDDAGGASLVLEFGLGEVGCCAVGIEAVQVDERGGHVGVGHSGVGGEVERAGCVDGGVGELQCVGVVSGPGADEGERAQRVDPPHRVAHAREAQRTLEGVRAVVQVALQEPGDRGGVLGHDLDRVEAADAEEVRDVVAVEQRDRVEDVVCGLERDVGGQVAVDEDRVEGVAGGSFTSSEIGSSDDPPVGLRRGRTLVGGDVGGEQVDAEGGRCGGPRSFDLGEPADERGCLASFEQQVTDFGDGLERLVVLVPAAMRCGIACSTRPWSISHWAAESWISGSLGRGRWIGAGWRGRRRRGGGSGTAHPIGRGG